MPGMVSEKIAFRAALKVGDSKEVPTQNISVKNVPQAPVVGPSAGDSGVTVLKR